MQVQLCMDAEEMVRVHAYVFAFDWGACASVGVYVCAYAVAEVFEYGY